MRKSVSHRNYIFVRFTSFAIFLLILVFVLVYSLYRWHISESSKTNLKTICSSLNSMIFTELDKMNTVSMNVVYSNIVRESFQEFKQSSSAFNTGDIENSYDAIENLYGIIMAIIGPFQSVLQVNLYNIDASSKIGSGFNQSFSRALSTSSFSRLEDVLALDGRKYISAPLYNPDLPGENKNSSSKMFISLARVLKDKAENSDGIVEVIQVCDKIFKSCASVEEEVQDINVIIYNERSEIVYPYLPQEAREYEQFPQVINDMLKSHNNNKIHLLKKGAFPKKPKMYFCVDTIEDYNWTLVVTDTQRRARETFKAFQIIFIAIALFTVVVISILCLHIADRLAFPLRKFSDSLQDMTLNKVIENNEQKKFFLPSTNIAEILQLYEAFANMNEKLRVSTNNLVLSRLEELKAKLQVNQLFLSPHFIYNSLTNISVMAEEDMNDEIVSFCESLCDYLRYISDHRKNEVTIREELYFTEKYIDCMKYRFGDSFTYSISIDESIGETQIPKLIIQPLVENVFKYGFDKTDFWRLEVRAYSENGMWKIQVSDNGGLLSDEKKDEILNSFKNLNVEEEIGALKIGGGGLKNVYLRLYALYGENFIFDIEIEKNNFTAFTVGAPLERKSNV